MEWNLILILYGGCVFVLSLLIAGVIIFDIRRGGYRRFQKLEQEFDTFTDHVKSRQRKVLGVEDNEDPKNP